MLRLQGRRSGTLWVALRVLQLDWLVQRMIIKRSLEGKENCFKNKERRENKRKDPRGNQKSFPTPRLAGCSMLLGAGNVPECLEKSLLFALVPDSKFLQLLVCQQMWVPPFTGSLWEWEGRLCFSLWRTGFGYTVWNLPFTLKIYQPHCGSCQEGTGYETQLELKWWERDFCWNLSSNQRHRSSLDTHCWALK